MGKDDDINNHYVFTLLSQWMQEAQDSEFKDPHAVVLATYDYHGFPNARVVLIKHFDQDGFVFYTNSQSSKGKEIIENPKVSLCFYWKNLGRQLRVRGLVEKYCDRESDNYYASRPRESKIGAWASKQSQKMEHFGDLQESVQRYSSLYEGKEIPRPVWWYGFLIRPLSIEFWTEKPYRLHERIVFSREKFTEKWTRSLLYP
ncbi:pyridoxamine 5'-phosphate oxidase [Candidatus Liberibacter africanus]|uniref:Pyridoxamine 5'-phosphate oxidase n=1 Tax=Candidatus Liberibacter africanus PTSAPSY TaxID=1277257 RepID=A0A0G3I3S4_LIBAF|nr:pyridoxamine 5'-phosphate oxidase [Candidatus Liberibacter africanus]AKK20521.1 pyridoxamine 5'-phosphate oxidase [Candidatus Liberibacter africanus PTSAPSY]QTP64229.1 pyridoxamine 5'-phosphate oxidase [Candidatus Liberibacter africanus]